MTRNYGISIFVLTLIGLASLSLASRESAFIGYSELKGEENYTHRKGILVLVSLKTFFYLYYGGK